MTSRKTHEFAATTRARIANTVTSVNPRQISSKLRETAVTEIESVAAAYAIVSTKPIICALLIRGTQRDLNFYELDARA